MITAACAHHPFRRAYACGSARAAGRGAVLIAAITLQACGSGGSDPDGLASADRQQPASTGPTGVLSSGITSDGTTAATGSQASGTNAAASPGPTGPGWTYDLTAGANPGEGGGMDGSSVGASGEAGDAGGPASPVPRRPAVVAKTSGEVLELSWERQSNVVPGTEFTSNVSYYQILVRESPFGLLYPIRVGPAGPRDTRIPVTLPSYRVAVPRTPAQRTFVVQACNDNFAGRMGDGWWGCKLSAEFTVDGREFTYTPPTVGFGGMVDAVLVDGRIRIVARAIWDDPLAGVGDTPVQGFGAEDLVSSIGSVVSVVREPSPPFVAPNPYLITIDLGSPPYPNGKVPTIKVVEGRVSGVTGHLNRTFIGPLFKCGINRRVDLVAARPGQGSGPGTTAGNAVAAGVPTPVRPAPEFNGPYAFEGPRRIGVGWPGTTAGVSGCRESDRTPAFDANATFYQVLVRPTASSNLFPLGGRIPAMFTYAGVDLPATIGSPERYRIRACNVQSPPGTITPRTDGFSGCIDSREFTAEGVFVGD